MAVGVLLGVLCIVACNAIAPRIHVAAPLLLVVVGVLVSVQSFVHVGPVVIEPHLILGGVLPLLLFAAAVSMPAVSFRRNFGVIAGLSVTLVVITSLVLGALFAALLPGLGFAGGVAVGAVLSPTDAVATSIVKRLGVAPRVVAVLDGEAMLNDASALVVLRTAIAAVAAAGTTSIGGAIGSFALSIVIATAIGVGVGLATLFVRKRIHEATVNTLLSFAVPLLAFQPAEHAGASGLVAVVAAGLVIGQGAPRFLAPAHRANERINWHMIEMLLEGGLFLLMGLQLVDLLQAGLDVGHAFGLAGLALGIVLAIRALYVVPLLRGVRKQQRRYEAFREKLHDLQHTPTDAAKAALEERENAIVDKFQRRIRRALADADYGVAHPLTLRDSVLLVWAGMRGAITLAAAQTLPAEFPHRSLLLLVAFLVATSSLLVQGGTLAWVVRRLKFPPPDEVAVQRERDALANEVIAAGTAVLDAPELRAEYGDQLLDGMRERLVQARDPSAFARSGVVIDRVFDAQRDHVLRARREGVYSTEALAAALQRIDAMQIGMGISRRGSIVGEDE